MHDSIVVLKLIPGTKPDLVEYLFQNYDCIVIESFGVGGIPRTLLDVFYEQMEKWIRKGKIVVMATQVVNEGSNMEVYEVGQKIKKDFHLMEAYDMTLEATITKLMYLMAECGNDYTAVYDGFYKTVNYDLISR
jgi:L-asparaginase